ARYLVIAPEAFLEAAWPLLELRASQGLSSFAVSTEQIFSEFGHGETRPQALQYFLQHAFHHWAIPPRYVLLLGDATFDFKDYLQWGVSNQVPPYPLKTAYIWTASDPAYALVNGDDILPDLALGRLPAANLDEARAMVDKILAYESEGLGLDGRAVLIADQSDAAGDFEGHADELAGTLLHAHDVSKIYLSQLGTAATHDAILQAFDDGSSLMSFIGHGGMQLWNHNILRVVDVASLAPQTQQPLLLTMNCLNGYFQFPLFDSLSESLLKAEGKGVIAAFSPSGLSLDGPAHLYHRLLLTELLHGGHATLGDAILAAQGKYVDAGGHLELLEIYHLLGDPALRLGLRPPTP
ncbi:MAG: C25 family cysteine peptidase, partial [Gammaproteobacteria bacterium]